MPSLTPFPAALCTAVLFSGPWILGLVSPLQAQPLVRAAKGGHLEEVKALLAEAPDSVNVPDEAGYTPLRWAGIQGHGEIARLLLDAGADPNSVGADGGTPMHGAAHHDDLPMMEALLAAGGAVTVENRWGRRPLHVAARRGCLAVARALLDAGADPDATTREGWSTLNVAYRGGHPELVELLLAAGADPALPDAEGRRPGEVELERPEAVLLDRRQLDAYVGHYDLGGGFGFDVWRVGDEMRIREFAPDKMVPVGIDTFFTVQEPWRVTFRRNERNEVMGVDVNFLRRTVSAERTADPSGGFSYVGSENCRECHTAKEGGGPYDVWTESPHRQAWIVLTTDRGKALAAARKEYREIQDPSRDQRCLMCHVTAGQNSLAQWLPGASAIREGVGCEACHGPGSGYMTPGVMRDTEAFLANGGRIPDEITCRQCHRDTGFDFARWVLRIHHGR